MKSFMCACAVSVAGVMGAASLAVGQSSVNSVTYQGVLERNGQAVPDGTYNITFRLYNVATGGVPLQTVTVNGVQTSAGRFSTRIPVPSALVTTNPESDLYWAIVIDGQELTPRTLVTSAPYALTAANLSNRAGPLTTGLLSQLPAEGSIGEGVWGNYLVASNAADRQLRLGSSNDGYTKSAIVLENANSIDGVIKLQTGTGSAAPRTGLFIESRGRVGIGTFDQALSARLYVQETEIAQYALRVDNRVSNRGIYISTVPGGTGAPLVIDHDGMRFLTVFQSGITSVRVLQITGGSDLAEPFPASPATDGAIAPKPGMILSIDAANPGALRVATDAYDTAVAGVYSGGNGLPTGMIMGKAGCELTSPGEDKLPLAMTGRVWVYADESNGAILPGDRLTSSGVKPGHAMKAIDSTRADGAVIGKAMTRVDEKTGMVMVLVNLQ